MYVLYDIEECTYFINIEKGMYETNTESGLLYKYRVWSLLYKYKTRDEYKTNKGCKYTNLKLGSYNTNME